MHNARVALYEEGSRMVGYPFTRFTVSSRATCSFEIAEINVRDDTFFVTYAPLATEEAPYMRYRAEHGEHRPRFRNAAVSDLLTITTIRVGRMRVELMYTSNEFPALLFTVMSSTLIDETLFETRQWRRLNRLSTLVYGHHHR